MLIKKNSIKAIVFLLFILALAGGYFLNRVLASATSTFTAAETVPNVTVGTDDQTFALANIQAAIVPGTDDQTAVIATSVDNIIAGTDDQALTLENITPNTTAGFDTQTFDKTAVTPNIPAGTDNQTAAVATSVENVVVGTDDQYMSTSTIADAWSAGVDNQALTATTTTSNVVEVKAWRNLAVNNLPGNGEWITIGSNCVVTFTASSTVTDDELDCSDNAATVDRDISASNTPRTASEIGAVLRSLTDVNDTWHGAIAFSGATTTVTYATAGTEINMGGVSFSDNTGGDITSSSNGSGVVAVAQVSTFTPSNVQNGDGFYASINSNTYAATSTESTTQNVVELLQPLMDADPAVICTEDNTKVTCTAVASGTPFIIHGATVNRPVVYHTFTFTPVNLENGDIFSITIDAVSNQAAAASDSVKDLVEELASDINDDVGLPNIECSEDNAVITCQNQSSGMNSVFTATTTNRSAVAQVMTYTPADVDNGDGFYAAINGITYAATATAATAQNVVEALQPLMEADADVTCIEDNIRVICTAIATGTPFDLTSATANYQGQAQVDDLLPAEIDAGDIFTITGISDSPISFTATSSLAGDAIYGLIAAIEATSTEITAMENSGQLRLTAMVPGTAFTATPSAANRESAYQIDDITPANMEIGDTFSIAGISDSAISFIATTTSASHIVNYLADAINATSTAVTAVNNNDKLRLTATASGTPFTAVPSAANREAAYQICTMTPADVEFGDIFSLTINSDNYLASATASSAKNILEIIQPLISELLVNCTEDDTSLTCTSLASGTPFTINATTTNYSGQLQIDEITAAEIETGDIFSVDGISDSQITFTATTTTATHIVDALATAINATSTSVTAVNNGDTLRLTADTPGVPFTATTSTANRAAVAQAVTFTPAGVTVDETFNAIINGSTYSFKATAATVNSVVEGLKPLMDANASTTCAEDDMKITCAADVAGLAFTYSASVTEAANPTPSGGGGGGYFPTSYCTSVIYSGWSDCANGKQYRDITTQTPSGCTLTSTQQTDRERACLTDSGDADRTTEPLTGSEADKQTASLDPIRQYQNESAKIAEGSYADVLSEIGTDQNKSAEDLAWAKYAAKLVSGGGLTYDQNGAINKFIAYGTVATLKLGAGERAGVVNSYKAAYNRLPVTAAEWEDVIKIANGRWPGEKNHEKETESAKIFKQIYRRDNLPEGYKDKAAIVIITYGLRIGQRDVKKEAAALATFKDIYKRLPSSTADWDILRAIAYSGARRKL